MNKTIDRKKRKIELLGDHRTRLIADVVTVELDVRDAAADLTDSTPRTDQDENETFLAEFNLVLPNISVGKEANT